GRDLTPQGYIEINPDTTLCPEVPNFINDKPVNEYTVTVSPNPFTNQIAIHFDNAVTENNTFEIYNSLGQRLMTTQSNKQDVSIQTTDLTPGFYLLKVN